MDNFQSLTNSSSHCAYPFNLDFEQAQPFNNYSSISNHGTSIVLLNLTPGNKKF